MAHGLAGTGAWSRHETEQSDLGNQAPYLPSSLKAGRQAALGDRFLEGGVQTLFLSFFSGSVLDLNGLN